MLLLVLISSDILVTETETETIRIIQYFTSVFS